jgi:hypothetical protein
VFRILLGELEFLPRQLGCWRRHRGKVDVRPTRQRDSPMCHRAFRVEPSGFLERADGRAVIKTMQEGQFLIEVTLRPRRIGCDFA